MAAIGERPRDPDRAQGIQPVRILHAAPFQAGHRRRHFGTLERQLLDDLAHVFDQRGRDLLRR